MKNFQMLSWGDGGGWGDGGVISAHFQPVFQDLCSTGKNEHWKVERPNWPATLESKNLATTWGSVIGYSLWFYVMCVGSILKCKKLFSLQVTLSDVMSATVLTFCAQWACWEKKPNVHLIRKIVTKAGQVRDHCVKTTFVVWMSQKKIRVSELGNTEYV